MILGAKKGVHRAVLCQEISYQIRSKCDRFMSSKTQFQNAKLENIFGQQTLIWEPYLVYEESL